MEDPIQRHPTRPEQLDILTSVMADAAARLDRQPARVLDLGCGTGYVTHRLMRKNGCLDVTGVDLSGDALAQAETNLRSLPGRFGGVAGDLMKPRSIALQGEFDLVCICLTFHDLTDPDKQEVIRWVANMQGPGGVFFIYDRVRLMEPGLFPLQQSIWARIEDVYGRGMRTADSFEAYESDLGHGNDPATFDDYLRWYRDAGYRPACLHLHGNLALFAGVK